jgi:hypothetical protein
MAGGGSVHVNRANMLAMANGLFVVAGESPALRVHDVAARCHAEAENFF